ncbi:MAG: outer membrane beta-barrel protein [Fimbriimonadaceae bacterium]
MNRRIMLAASALAAVTALTASATAQESKPMGLSLRAGIFFPSSDAARAENKTWIGMGAEFKIKDMNFGMSQPGMSSHLSLSVDYMGSGDFRSLPVLVNWVARNNQFYYTAGLGYTFGRNENAGVTEERNALAYSLGVGWDFQQGSTPFFAEGRFWGSSESDFNGFGIYVGVRI